MIYKGSQETSNILKGTTEIQVVYKGTTEVWSNKQKIYYLGSGKTFNVVSFCNSKGIDYKSLTIDDFFFTPYSDSVTIASGSASWRSCTYGVDCWCGSSTAQGSYGAGSGSTGVYSTKRTYNAETGALTLYYGVNANVYILPNSEVHINKGLIESITNGGDVSSDAKGYGSASVKNFLYRSLPNDSASIESCCSDGCPYWFAWNKSYDNESGIYKGYFDGHHTTKVSASAFYFSPKKFTFIS